MPAHNEQFYESGDMKITTTTTLFFVKYGDLMRSLLKDSAKRLISQCNAYQKRHGKKSAV
jgi:hemolysin E